jgi:hypothetical protein
VTAVTRRTLSRAAEQDRSVSCRLRTLLRLGREAIGLIPVVRHGYDQIDRGTCHRLATRQIAGNRYPGWIQIPGQAIQQPEA